jgi:hypothetical protein
MKNATMLTILVLVLGLVGNASASMVAHYELAADFNDSSGNSLHGAAIGGASILLDPERGDVLSLGGAGEYVDCGNNALFDITEAITVAGWIKVNAFDVEWQAVVAKGSTAWRLSRDGINNGLEFACNGLSGNLKVLGSQDVNDGVWHHVAGVYDGSEISLYVDGILDASLAASGTIATNTYQVCIGGNVDRPGREWNGLLDDVRIYDHALSAAEIAGLAGKMGTGYTYQGRLLDGNNPAERLYDFEFKLYSDPSIGVQEGNTISINDLDVIDGYFTVELDFGGVFIGDARWLEIGVRPGELEDPNVYTVLTPRQEVTPVPYALQTRGIFVDNAGNVGIGTTSPDDKLDVAGTVIATAFVGDGSGLTGIAGDSDWIISGNDMYTGAGVTGNVGIGTTSPDQTLHVNGSLRVQDYSFFHGGIYAEPWILVDEISLGYGGSNSRITSYDTDEDITIDPAGAGDIVLQGNVGIGTTEPNDKLDVNGNINANSVYKIVGQTVLANPGTHNLFVGVGAGASNTDGEENTFLGYRAGYSNTGDPFFRFQGRYNTFVGKAAGYSNNTGYLNTFVGHHSGINNTTGIANTLVGNSAGASNETGGRNTFLGTEAGRDKTEGDYNTFVGCGAGTRNLTGNKNTFVGDGAGRENQAGSGNVFIGYKAGYYEEGNHTLCIANGPYDSNTLIWGDFSTGRVGIGTTGPGAKLDVIGTIKLGVSGAPDVLDAYPTNVYLKAPNGSIHFQTPNGTNRMSITSSGNARLMETICSRKCLFDRWMAGFRSAV